MSYTITAYKMNGKMAFIAVADSRCHGVKLVAKWRRRFRSYKIFMKRR
jgi:hypothetical protein